MEPTKASCTRSSASPRSPVSATPSRNSAGAWGSYCSRSRSSPVWPSTGDHAPKTDDHRRWLTRSKGISGMLGARHHAPWARSGWSSSAMAASWRGRSTGARRCRWWRSTDRRVRATSSPQAETAARKGVAGSLPDRPGYGHSSYHPGRTYETWARRRSVGRSPRSRSLRRGRPLQRRTERGRCARFLGDRLVGCAT